SEPFGPYGAALREGYRPTAAVPAGDSVSFSIATPMATWQGWNALTRTGGSAASADDDMTMRAQHELASRDGVFLEASSATAVAVLPELIARGDVSADESVVLLGTSSGLKDVPTTAARLPDVPVIGPDMADLLSAIGEA
ncbi:MAG: pyridoxal-phosphate dependent enzyme, partial [Microbacterium sp.]